MESLNELVESGCWDGKLGGGSYYLEKAIVAENTEFDITGSCDPLNPTTIVISKDIGVSPIEVVGGRCLLDHVSIVWAVDEVRNNPTPIVHGLTSDIKLVAVKVDSLQPTLSAQDCNTLIYVLLCQQQARYAVDIENGHFSISGLYLQQTHGGLRFNCTHGTIASSAITKCSQTAVHCDLSDVVFHRVLAVGNMEGFRINASKITLVECEAVNNYYGANVVLTGRTVANFHKGLYIGHRMPGILVQEPAQAVYHDTVVDMEVRCTSGI
jgi:hypothetical protein